jgi:hypothetical protein
MDAVTTYQLHGTPGYDVGTGHNPGLGVSGETRGASDGIQGFSSCANKSGVVGNNDAGYGGFYRRISSLLLGCSNAPGPSDGRVICGRSLVLYTGWNTRSAYYD